MRFEEVVTIAEAAERIGCSASKVREHVRSGRVAAERVGNQWFIARDELARFDRTTPVGRPYSERLSWALLAELEGRALGPLHRQERARIASYRSDPPTQVRARLRGRAHTLLLSVSTPTLDRLADDRRWVIGGGEAARHHLGSFHACDQHVLYLPGSLTEAFLDTSLAVPDDLEPNLVLKVVDDPCWLFDVEIDRYVWGSVAWLDCHESGVDDTYLRDLWPPSAAK